MTVAVRVALLMGLWLLAWGEATVANVVSGAAVAAVLLVAFPAVSPASSRVAWHLPSIAKLGGYILVQLVSSNLWMARELLRRRPTVRPGVLSYRLQAPSEHVVTVMTGVIALSPGTMTVDVAPDSSEIAVHFLFLHDVDAARAGLARLEQLVASALRAGAPSTRGSE